MLIEIEPNGQGPVTFGHALAGRAVYEAIPSRQRRKMHLLAAWALEDLSPLSAARLAWHFREAGDTASWARYAQQAADLALASGDENTAAALLYDLRDHGYPAAGRAVSGDRTEACGFLEIRM